MEQNILERLESISRESGRMFRDYPKGCCWVVSERVWHELGMPVVYGFFMKNGTAYEHYWNYNPDLDEIIDLTACQFEPEIPGILVLPRESPEARRMYMEWFASS